MPIIAKALPPYSDGLFFILAKALMPKMMASPLKIIFRRGTKKNKFKIKDATASPFLFFGFILAFFIFYYIFNALYKHFYTGLLKQKSYNDINLPSKYEWKNTFWKQDPG